MLNPNYSTKLQGKNGGCVEIHDACDKNKLAEHLAAAQVLADKGHLVQLLPEVHRNDAANRRLFFPELNNASNPDLRLNNKLGDFKIPDSNPVKQNHISAAITQTAKKEVPTCIISLLNRNYSRQKILNGIRSALKQSGINISIEEVWIIFNDKSIMKIPRGIVSRNDFYKLVQAF